jgi:hypothetical protein
MANDSLRASHEKRLEATRAASAEFLHAMHKCFDDWIRLMNEQHQEKMAALDALGERLKARRSDLT